MAKQLRLAELISAISLATDLGMGQPLEQALSISPSTVDHHVRHIYDKAGVQTRAGATLFALEHDLMK